MLTKRLVETRDSVLKGSVGLRMLGSEVVCDSVVIGEICRIFSSSAGIEWQERHLINYARNRVGVTPATMLMHA